MVSPESNRSWRRPVSGNLQRLRSTHPNVILELLMRARPVDLKRGEADLAIRSGPSLMRL
jgi:DNA-binding transcriptional LysR family regulator